MTRHRANTSEKQLINRLIVLIEQGDVQGMDMFVEQHGNLTNLFISEESGLHMHHPVLHKVIKHGSVEQVQHFMRGVEFDPEDDPLIGTAIRTGNSEIVRAVIDLVPSIDHWVFVEFANRMGNQTIIDMIQQWATRDLI